MNTEEKAKAYNKVREKIALRFGSNVAEEIFSEFEMSEDEKIKRNIIAALKGEGYYDCDLTNECIAWLEKQGEHTDKVEPKFQNGQWIVWQNKCYKVNYNGCGYELIDQNGLSTSLEYGTVDTSARLYDVTKDAKDCDVLYSLDSKQPFIFKHRNPNEQAEVYCGINIYGKFFVWNTKDCIITTDKYVPATKEQRDTLERAITNAGYRWDKETHELKKISQRMVSAEAKEALYDEPTDEEMKELLRTEYEKGRADTIAEMKSSWSEEDERMIDNIIFELEENQENISGVGYKIDWLKQLKQRIGG